MSLTTDNHVTPEDLVALVICREHTYFRQLGKVSLDNESNLKITFRDGQTDKINPEQKQKYGWSPIEFFYRHRNELGIALDQRGEGPLGLIKTFTEKLQGDISDLIAQYKEIFN